MKILAVIVFIFAAKILPACECPLIKPVSKEICKEYDVIFFGKTDSISVCTEQGRSSAYFTITELYKGAVQQYCKVDFDCSSACMMSFSKDEEWLIYASFKRFDLLTVNLCSHCRKWFADPLQDFYQAAATRTFEKEKQFLKTELGIQSFAKNNKLNEEQADLKPHNEQPSPMDKLWLLLISLLVMLVVFFITKNKKRK